MSTKNTRAEEAEAAGLGQPGLYNKTLSQSISTIHIGSYIWMLSHWGKALFEKD